MGADITEQEMRRALGLDSNPLEPKQAVAVAVATKMNRPLSPKLRVTLTVKKGNGLAERFVHDADTLSQFEAIEQAKKAAKGKKLTFWAMIGVEQVD